VTAEESHSVEQFWAIFAEFFFEFLLVQTEVLNNRKENNLLSLGVFKLLLKVNTCLVRLVIG